MKANNYTPSLDKYQIPVVEASHGYHLVLVKPVQDGIHDWLLQQDVVRHIYWRRG